MLEVYFCLSALLTILLTLSSSGAQILLLIYSGAAEWRKLRLQPPSIHWAQHLPEVSQYFAYPSILIDWRLDFPWLWIPKHLCSWCQSTQYSIFLANCWSVLKFAMQTLANCRPDQTLSSNQHIALCLKEQIAPRQEISLKNCCNTDCWVRFQRSCRP